MANETNQIESNEARMVLDSIQGMARAGLRRATPPLWFGATIALLAGVLCTFAGLGISRLYMAPLFLLMVLIVVYQTHKAGVIVRPQSKRMIIMVLIGMLAILIPLILVIREHLDTFGPWAALSLGIAITIAGFVLSVFERRAYLTKINTEKSE